MPVKRAKPSKKTKPASADASTAGTAGTDRVKLQMYADADLRAQLHAHRRAEEVDVQFSMSPSRKLPLTTYICSVLYRFCETKSAYDKSNPGGGWAGYWEAVSSAVSPPKKKKKGRR